jgi:flagellar motility protein MotE (MotC chaperone)
MSGVRALPLVVAAALAMLALKVLGMASGDGWALRFDEPAVAAVRDTSYRPVAWAHEQATVTSGEAATKAETARPEAKPDIADPATTASTPPKNKEETPPAAEPSTTPGAITPNALQNSDGERSTPGERAVLERLTDRREELEGRAKEIEMRETLLQAAEKRVEARIKELEAIEARISASKTAPVGAEGAPAPDSASPAKIKDLVTMYENMRPKDAAKIFDDLNLRVLVDVSKQMNPRKLGDVIAQMKPESAQRLTVELAGPPRKIVVVPAGATAVQSLPQIRGVPTQP